MNNKQFNPKIHSRSKLGLSPSSHGPKGKLTIEPDQDTRENLELLFKAERMYSELYKNREEAARFRRYERGDQWSDTVTSPNGVKITEEQNILRQGKIPLKNNQIGPIIDNILGTYLKNQSKSIIVSRTKDRQADSDMLQNALEACLGSEESDLVDAKLLRKLLIEKIICSKVKYGFNPERDISDGQIDIVALDRLFFNLDIEDVRTNKDLNFIGEFMDVPLDKVVASFAKNKNDEQLIREMYSPHRIDTVTNSLTSSGHRGFFETPFNNNVRVYSIWYKKGEWRIRYHDSLDATYESVPYNKSVIAEIAETNTGRIQQGTAAGMPEEEIPLIDYEEIFDEVWYYKYLTPSGYALSHGETPYEHGSHPYSLTMVERGLVENIIDQQRYINRLITLIDFIIGASAKGVLLVPENVVGDMSMDEISSEWTKFNGVIAYKPDKNNPNAVPKQIVANSTNIGVFDLLNLQLSLMEKISGVSGAMQGQGAAAGTPASLYAQEAQNSSTNLVYVLHTFMRFKERRDMKLAKVITQFYNEERFISVAGALDDKAMYYTPERAKNLDWDLRVTEGTSTPVYRQLQEDYLWKLFEGGAIGIEQFLSNSSLPFTDKLLDQINKASQSETPEERQQALAAARETIPQGEADEQGQQLINQLLG